MKKPVLSLILFLALCLPTDAQQVYLQIREKAQREMSNQMNNQLVRQFNHFKVDALDYMAMKMKEQMPDSSATFLDREAFALNNFMQSYLTTLLNMRTQPAAYQVKVMQLYMDASYSNPLFNDPDKELVLAYYADGDCLTRFSLDTDWRRAFIAVETELKKIK